MRPLHRGPHLVKDLLVHLIKRQRFLLQSRIMLQALFIFGKALAQLLQQLPRPGRRPFLLALPFLVFPQPALVPLAYHDFKLVSRVRLHRQLSFFRRETHASSPSRKPNPSVGTSSCHVISHKSLLTLCFAASFVSFVVQSPSASSFLGRARLRGRFCLPITDHVRSPDHPISCSPLPMYPQPDPTPHRRFVENKRQTPIRKACRKAVDPSFSRFFDSESRCFCLVSASRFRLVLIANLFAHEYPANHIKS